MTLRATAVVTVQSDRIQVNVVWGGAELDRPTTYGFGLKANHAGLATRLKRAIDAQAVFTDPKIVNDVNGHTYVMAKCLVMGRYLNADLKRLGY